MTTTKSAIVLTPEQRDEFLELVPEVSRMPARDVLIFMLSFYGGMRVCEIAQLTVDAMLGPRGEILYFIRIFPHTTKRNAGRMIPAHERIRSAFTEFLEVYPDAEGVAISPRDERMMTPAALGRAMERIYRDAGYAGCRSHTGRATCLTEMAKYANLHGCTLEEVQRFAGHKRLETTAGYLGPTGCLANLVNALGSPNNNERRMNNGAIKESPRYRQRSAGVRVDDNVRRPGASIPGEPRTFGDGRRSEERLARRLQNEHGSHRKLRKARTGRHGS